MQSRVATNKEVRGCTTLQEIDSGRIKVFKVGSAYTTARINDCE